MATMDYTYNSDLNLVILHPVGIVTAEDILAYGNELLEKGYMTQDTIEYVDMSDIKDLTLNFSSAHLLLTMHDKWLAAGWFGSYYYAPKDIHVGIVTMVSSIVKAQPNRNLPEDIMLPLREKIVPEEIREYLQKHRSL